MVATAEATTKEDELDNPLPLNKLSLTRRLNPREDSNFKYLNAPLIPALI